MVEAAGRAGPTGPLACGLGDGIYQMFSELCAVIVLNDSAGNTAVRVLDEVPVRRLHSGLPVGGATPTVRRCRLTSG